jgi:hypothetical protein
MKAHIYTFVCVFVLVLGMGARLIFPADSLGHDLVLISVTALLTHGEWLRNQSKGE